jgi:hypothetical protein
VTVTITSAVQTCAGMPSQWDAWDAEGQYYYLRFRHGQGTIRREPSQDLSTWAWPKSEGDLVGSFEDGDEWAGIIELDEFCRRAGVVLALTEYKSFGEYAAEKLREALAHVGTEDPRE